MAYMDGNKGPYPNKAGDWCRNHLLGSQAYARSGMTHSEAQENQKVWLSTMRFGRPRPYEGKTTEELEAAGFVGLYLKQDHPPMVGSGKEVEIPTPPELMEPPQ